jgi:serine/threonine-protein phosphatase PGAM5
VGSSSRKDVAKRQNLPARRLVVLVRHGQYDVADSQYGALTPTGCEQAVHVGNFLARSFSFDAVHASSLVRARETATIVTASLGLPYKVSKLLREGCPSRVESLPHAPSEIAEDRERFERAFERFFKPAKKRTTELVVCHGNIIRYFVCRALGVPVKSWIRYGTNHTGITRIVVKANGEMGVASYNETGHLPRKLVT